MQNGPLTAPQTHAVESTGILFSARNADKTILWKPFSDRELFCEMSAPDTALLNSAATVFAPWLHAPTELPVQSPVFRWCVAPVESFARSSSASHPCQSWCVRGRVNGIDQELVVPDRKSALMVVEYSAAQVLADYVAGEEGSAQTGLFAIHSALLCRDGFGVLVVGPSEAGKSTLSCALWQSDWSLRSDDFVFIDSDGVARPIPRRVSLRRSSRALLDESLWERICNSPSSWSHSEGQLFHPHEVEENGSAHAQERCEPVTIGAIVFLGRRGSAAGPAQLCLQNPANAALALLPYSTLLPRASFERDDGTAVQTAPAVERVLDWGAALPKIAPLAARVPIYDLGRGPLPQMVAAIETLKEAR
jgi:hypothetical protein